MMQDGLERPLAEALSGHSRELGHPRNAGNWKVPRRRSHFVGVPDYSPDLLQLSALNRCHEQPRSEE
jgi:hypothetical protein